METKKLSREDNRLPVTGWTAIVAAPAGEFVPRTMTRNEKRAARRGGREFFLITSCFVGLTIPLAVGRIFFAEGFRVGKVDCRHQVASLRSRWTLLHILAYTLVVVRRSHVPLLLGATKA